MELNFKITKEFTDSKDAFKSIVKKYYENGYCKTMAKFITGFLFSTIILVILYEIAKNSIYESLLIPSFIVILVIAWRWLDDMIWFILRCYKEYYKGFGYYESDKFVITSIENIYSDAMHPFLLNRKINYSDLNDQSKSNSLLVESSYELGNDLQIGSIFSVKTNDDIFYDSTSKLIELERIEKYSDKKIINHGKIIKIAK